MAKVMIAVGTALIGGIFSLAMPASAKSESTLRMAFSITPSTPILPYLVAQDTGWYKAHGLQVQETTVLGDANTLRAVISGSADVAQLGLTTTLQAVAESDAPIKLIGSWQPVVDYQFIAAKGPIKTLADFKGKVFATGSPGDLTFEIPKMIFKKHHIDGSGITYISVGPHPNRLTAIVGGKAQVSMVNLLTAERGVQDGSVNIIRAVKDDFPELGFSYLVTSAADTQDPAKRKAIAILIEGGIYGARFIMENPDAAAQVLHKRVPEMPVAFIKKVIVDLNKLKVWGVDGGLDKEPVQFTSDLSVQYKEMARPVDAARVIDTEFVDQAVSALGKAK